MHAPQIGKDRSATVAQGAADPGRRLPRAGVWLVWAVSGLGVTLGVLAFVYGALNYDSLSGVLTSVALQALWAISFPLVGAVIATHRPRNPLGWIFLVIGVSKGLVVFGYEYASYVFRTAPGTAPGGELAVWVAQWAWAPGLGLALTFVPLLFPDGRLPSRRWRPVAWLSAIPIVVSRSPRRSPCGPGAGRPCSTPHRDQGIGDLESSFFVPYILMLGCGLACLAALLLRFRRARGIERQQLKWLLFASAVTIAIFLVVQPNTSETWELGLLLAVPFLPSVPVAAGIAILRYRLYEIDRIDQPDSGLRAAHRRPWPGLCGWIADIHSGGGGRVGPAELAGRRRHPGRSRGVPAGPPSDPGRGGPALQSAPLQRGQDDRGVQRPTSR